MPATFNTFNSCKKKLRTYLLSSRTSGSDGGRRICSNESKTGICVSSSGPGATNLITGIACSFYDSVPVIAITGQVSTFRMKGKSEIRQKGFQETPIVEMVKGITKYAIQIKDANEVPRELRKAYEVANDGRKGPVWIDIPDDIQREEIDMEDNWIDIYNNDDNIEMPEGNNRNLEDKIAKTIKMIKEAERPVLVGGWGINISGMRKEFKILVEQLKIPVVLTWAAADVLDKDEEMYIGTFGTHGIRSANFTVQNSDLVISLGSRLDTKATGTPVKTFARGAKKIMFDIDNAEVEKFEGTDLNIDLFVKSDLRESIPKFIDMTQGIIVNTGKWLYKIKEWKVLDEIDNKAREKQDIEGFVEPYKILEELPYIYENETNFIFDTGCAVAW